MKMKSVVITALLWILLVLTLAPPSLAVDAAEKVAEGIRLFRKGDYQGARIAFAEADVALPENLLIAFDQACAYAGLGDMEKATEYFEQAALARDEAVALLARYNLGCMAAEKARVLFGEQPEGAPPETREEGAKLLLLAVKHFRDCIDLDPDHEEARRNLELIRLWLKHMDAVWKEKDRQKAREEMNLLQFLEMIEGRQLALMALSKGLGRERDSPRRRQALIETEEEQRLLLEEIDYLKEKIEESLAAPAAPPGGAQPSGQGGMDPEQAAKAAEVLKEWAEEARGHMAQAADLIPGTPEEALPEQQKVVENLDRIYGAVAPYANMVEKALKTQQALVDTTIPLVETRAKNPEAEYPDLSWIEGRVSGWSEILGYKANQGLEGMKSQTPPPGGQPGQPDQAKEQMEGLKRSMEKAVKHCPRIQSLTKDASELLEGEDASAALPKEEEALKLLKEIAEELPKQDQDQDQQGDQDQDQQQDQNQDQQQDQQQQDPQQQKRPDRNLSREEAEALLQKAKEREREHREKQEEMQRALMRPRKVDKDW